MGWGHDRPLGPCASYRPTSLAAPPCRFLMRTLPINCYSYCWVPFMGPRGHTPVLAQTRTSTRRRSVLKWGAKFCALYLQNWVPHGCPDSKWPRFRHKRRGAHSRMRPQLCREHARRSSQQSWVPHARGPGPPPTLGGSPARLSPVSIIILLMV